MQDLDAALATILKTLGIFTTEAELAKLAGNDEEGTSLYGLKTASLSKGVNVVGVRLTIDQLQPNYLVVLNIDGTKHFEIVRNITNTTVYLFDPNLGDIQINRSKFNELYIGVALIINGTAPANATILTDDEMRNIKALGYWARDEHSFIIPGYSYPTLKWVNFNYPVPVLRWRYVAPYKLFGFIPIPGHMEPYIAIDWRVGSRPTLVWHHVPARKVTYYTPRYVFVKGDQLNENKFLKAAIGLSGMVTTARMIIAGAGMIGATEGLGTVPGLIMIGAGSVGFKFAFDTFADSLDDPWVINIYDPPRYHTTP